MYGGCCDVVWCYSCCLLVVATMCVALRNDVCCSAWCLVGVLIMRGALRTCVGCYDYVYCDSWLLFVVVLVCVDVLDLLLAGVVVCVALD